MTKQHSNISLYTYVKKMNTQTVYKAVYKLQVTSYSFNTKICMQIYDTSKAPFLLAEIKRLCLTINHLFVSLIFAFFIVSSLCNES